MFQNIEGADLYVMVDGDDTLRRPDSREAGLPPPHCSTTTSTGGRTKSRPTRPPPRGHRLGNRVLTGLVAGCSAPRSTIMLSGYACSSRRFRQELPIVLGGPIEPSRRLTVWHRPSSDGQCVVAQERPITRSGRRAREQAAHVPDRLADFLLTITT